MKFVRHTVMDKSKLNVDIRVTETRLTENMYIQNGMFPPLHCFPIYTYYFRNYVRSGPFCAYFFHKMCNDILIYGIYTLRKNSLKTQLSYFKPSW